MTSTKLNEFVDRVEKAPAWESLAPPELKERGRELDALGVAFQAFSTQDARAIVKRLSERSMKSHALDEPERSLSRIYVLLRYYFRVPNSERAENARYFGGWVGVPEKGQFVDLLWPLNESPDGSLHLHGTFHGYMGDAYDALGEFDYFNSKYGPRKTKGD